MYLRGNRWSMTRRPRRRSNPFFILLLLILIAGALYVNMVVVPVTPALFVPTVTPTRSPESFVNQAAEFVRQGKYPQAMDAYKASIESEPGNTTNYIELARLQVWANQYEDAIRNTQNALLKNPNNAMAHAVQGWALGLNGKPGEGEREIKIAISQDPNSALAYAYLAEILLDQNDYALIDKAAEASKRAQSIDPNLLEVHRARGLVLMNTQNVDQAIQEFQSALAINKNLADLNLNLGVAYKAAEKYDLAQEALLAAYALNPKDTVALTELSRSYFADGRFAQAAQYAEEAVKIDPTNPRLHGSLGVIYYKAQDYKKAIPELNLAVKGGNAADGSAVKALPLDYGRVEEYYWYLGFALTRSDRCAEAAPIFQALLNGVPNDDVAVYNANEGLAVCSGEAKGTGTPGAKTKTTPTPTAKGGKSKISTPGVKATPTPKK
jgi:tetratricopeptide (TPR) repeat protein